MHLSLAFVKKINQLFDVAEWNRGRACSYATREKIELKFIIVGIIGTHE